MEFTKQKNTTIIDAFRRIEESYNGKESLEELEPILSEVDLQNDLGPFTILPLDKREIMKFLFALYMKGYDDGFKDLKSMT